MTVGAPRILKRYVSLPGGGEVHYRVAGSGPCVVLLHDSPRSSSMHEALMTELAVRFTVFALDTPGYGNSTPLPATPRPEIPDFAAALAHSLEALGIARCAIYGFHTSSKITLQFAVDHPERVALAIMDGLNLPPGGPPAAFIERYMKPFVVEEDGSHFASLWTRARDLHRFFPWFERSLSTRIPQGLPSDEALHAYALDMLRAGRHYASAYAAAMRFLALPVVPRLRVPAVFMCRRTDPLYPYLDALPDPLPPGSSIERLPGDRESWRDRIAALFESAAARASTRTTVGAAPPVFVDPRLSARRHPALPRVRGYVDLPAGQIHVTRFGHGSARPVVLLHEVPGSAGSLAALGSALGASRPAYAIDLPGHGESTALARPDAAAYVAAVTDAVVALLDDADAETVDMVAEFTASPLALALAARLGRRVHSLVLDGAIAPTPAERACLLDAYCPALPPRWDGTHLTSLWHRLRDQEIAWPWFDGSASAIRRRTPELDAETLHAVVVDVAKQPAAYGDAAAAAFERDALGLCDAVAQPVLLLDDPDDIRYGATGVVASRLARASVLRRPGAAADRATVIGEFLDGG